MKNRLLPLTLIVGCTVFAANAQTQPKTSDNAKTATEKSKDAKLSGKSQPASAAVALKSDATAMEMAKAALAAHGGEKLRGMKTLVTRGTGDFSSQNFPTTLTGAFAMIFSGDKYRLQIEVPAAPKFIQTFDGTNTATSIGSFKLPPINRLGLPLLAKIETEGFKVENLIDKKKRGFRITSPEGFATDFFVDDKTGQVKGYSATYSVDGNTVTTAVEIDKLKDTNGILLPEKYSQRFDLNSNMTIYGAFKVKEILVDSPVADDVFTLQNP